MRAFLLASLVAIVLAVAGAYALNALQQSSATAYIGDSVRLNQEERG